MPHSNLPNAPLGEVVFEIRFPGDLRLYALWGDLQAELREEFPALFAPKVVEGDAPTLKPFHLVSRDRSERVCLALNLFSYITQTYLDFGAFRGRYEGLLAAFLKRFRPPVITRAGLRYLNWLPTEFPGVTPERDQ